MIFGVVVALALIPSAYTTIRNTIVLGREDTRSQTRDWLVRNVPQGTKVVFEPVAPSEWYGVTAGGGPKADPARQWDRYTRSSADIEELAREYRGARYPASFQNYQRTLWPGMLDVYRREGYCWIVTGSTQYGRAQTEPHRVPQALRYYRALREQADVAFRASPVERDAAALPGRQVLQLRRRGLRTARSRDDRVQTARLHVISGVNASVRPLLLSLALLLLVPAAASARVVIVATDTANAVLIDTRDQHGRGQRRPAGQDARGGRGAGRHAGLPGRGLDGLDHRPRTRAPARAARSCPARRSRWP